MRGKLALVAIFMVALLWESDAEPSRRKKGRRRTTTSTTESAVEMPPELDDVKMEKLALEVAERVAHQQQEENERLRVQALLEHQDRDIEDIDEVYSDDPCSKIHCSAGRICEIDEVGEAHCNCIKECPFETDHRRKVCTNHNETWTSDCEVYQQHCLCMEESGDCKHAKYQHVQIEYYGACKEMPECQEDEMADFPRRMRDWLFNIMRDLVERRELSDHYVKMEQEAETNYTRRWTNAAIWKWCDLDAHDNDRFVSRHELFPIRAPLMSLEHCIGPFLNKCDADDDHKITLTEWIKCLGVDEDDIEDRCEEFTDKAE